VLVAPKGGIVWLSEQAADPSGQMPSDTVTRATFPRLYRLTKTDEFSSVFGFRKAIRSPHFLLHYRIPVTGEPAMSRLGVVVAKRLLKRSVDRNLVRRLARETYRLTRENLLPRDLILRLSVRPVELDRKALATEIQGLLQKMSATRR
jgi:ribonuclease P protein component